jgi:agmatine deiminase
MKNAIQIILPMLALLFAIILTSCEQIQDEPIINDQTEIMYRMPAEDLPHEGTWLQWPHDYGWDRNHRARYESIWIVMTKALHVGEKVHIVVYDEELKNEVTQLLEQEALDMSQIDFLIAPTNDVWARDNGPIFVRDKEEHLAILNWEFNGWGGKAPYRHDNRIPTAVSEQLSMPAVNLDLTLEGGSIEIDGQGTLMAKRSSILNNNRNPRVTQEEVEAYFRVYLGTTNFIWMDGVKGEDITDDHIDFTARFVNENTIVHTHRSFLSPGELAILQQAKNAAGESYKLVELPITKEIMEGAEIPGVYTNFYVGNTVVLVPNFDHEKDAEANAIIRELYPNKTVVGIDVRELYKDGGALHCVTQQQPVN